MNSRNHPKMAICFMSSEERVQKRVNKEIERALRYKAQESKREKKLLLLGEYSFRFILTKYIFVEFVI